ncbi:hypothetical protein Tco_0226216 [Tanacetum coccineum]
MQSPPQNSQKGSSQLEREHIKKDKGKKAMSSKDAEEMSTESDSDDETTHVPGSMVESPSYPDINQLTNLLVTSLKPEFSKLLASHDFASCLPNALKELPSKFIKLSREIKELKKHVQDMEIELPGFATVVENASRATTKDVSSAGQATASPAEGEKNTSKDAETNLQNELVDLLGIDVVEQYHNKKLLFHKYCDKMLKRRKSSKIINYDVITQKGPISLKVYREDGTIEVIANFKLESLKVLQRQLFRSLEDWEVSLVQFMQRLDLHEDCYIHDRWSPNGWIWNWRRLFENGRIGAIFSSMLAEL